MFKKIFLTLFALILVIGPVLAVKVSQIVTLATGGNFSLPPTAVTSAEVSEQEWQQTLNAVGSFSAVQGVNVSSELSGKIVKLHFESGESVEAGQLLLELDTSTEEAQLAAAVAEAQLAEINLERARKLRASNTVAQAELDGAQASHLAAQAQVTNLESIITKKQITAPFSGRLGIRQVDLGQFLNSGETIVSLQTVDPIYVDFAFPQNWISKIQTGMALEVTVDAFPESKFEGEVFAITPEVNVATRTIDLRGVLSNADGKLLPGMFGQVSVILPAKAQRKVVPGTAIVYASYGDSVFVITEKEGAKIVEQQFVRVGESRGDYISLLEGPSVGTPIVSTGAFKLRHGVPIVENNRLAPATEVDPKPEDS